MKYIQAGRCCVTLHGDGGVTLHDLYDDANKYLVRRQLLAATSAESCEDLARAFAEMAVARREMGQ